MTDDHDRDLLNFIAEAGMLKRVVRSGWSVLGIKDAETVAEHSFRCAVLGYVLARMENTSPYKVLLMTLFNDLHEARITDLHKMAQRYLPGIREAEDTAFREQIDSLPDGMRRELADMREEYNGQGTQESVIARDADILECLIQAREYEEQGFKEASRFMNVAPGFLETESARRLWELARSVSLNQWWEELRKFER